MMTLVQTKIFALRQRTELAQSFAADAQRLVDTLLAQADFLTASLRAARDAGSERESTALAVNIGAFSGELNRAAAALRRTHAGVQGDLRVAEGFGPIDPTLLKALQAAVGALGQACHRVAQAAERLEGSLAAGPSVANRLWLDAAGARPH